MQTHNLVKLADYSGTKLNKVERNFCDMGTESILTFGRYPVGLDYQNTPKNIEVQFKQFNVYGDLYIKLGGLTP